MAADFWTFMHIFGHFRVLDKFKNVQRNFFEIKIPARDFWFKNELYLVQKLTEKGVQFLRDQEQNE